MNSTHETNLFILLAVASLVAYFTFVYRRRKGKSNSIATASSVFYFGLTISFAFLFLWDFFEISERNTLGLERYVFPIMMIVFFGVLAVFAGLAVHGFSRGQNKAPESLFTSNVETIIKKAEMINYNTQEKSTDWRSFAISSANTKN